MTRSSLKISLSLLSASFVFVAAVTARTVVDTAEMLSKSGHRSDAIRVTTDALKQSPRNASLYALRASTT